MTRQTVDRILEAYPLGRRQPSAWQTVAIEIRPGWSAGWAITFYDEWNRQITCFGREKAEATLALHRAQASYLLFPVAA